MMLRASTFTPGSEGTPVPQGGDTAVDVTAVSRGNEVGSGVAHGEALIELAEAVVGAERCRIEKARQRVVEDLGVEAMVDAVCVVGNFQRMVRIADATGIPLDDVVLQLTEDIRPGLGVEAFHGAANTQRSSWFRRLTSGFVRAAMKRRVIAGQAPVTGEPGRGAR